GLIVLGLLSFVSPGLSCCRFLLATPLERLNLAVGFSLIIIYLSVLLLGLGGIGSYAYILLIGIALLGCFWERHRILEMFKDPLVRKVAGLWLMLVVWLLSVNGLIKSFSGGGWVVDWWEHYERSLFWARANF